MNPPPPKISTLPPPPPFPISRRAWLNRHEALLERAVAFRPDLIAMGSLTNLWPFCSTMAAKLKEKIGAPILVGGHHAHSIPDYILENPHVDMVCIGEGEMALLELA